MPGATRSSEPLPRVSAASELVVVKEKSRNKHSSTHLRPSLTAVQIPTTDTRKVETLTLFGANLTHLLPSAASTASFSYRSTFYTEQHGIAFTIYTVQFPCFFIAAHHTSEGDIRSARGTETDVAPPWTRKSACVFMGPGANAEESETTTTTRQTRGTSDGEIPFENLDGREQAAALHQLIRKSCVEMALNRVDGNDELYVGG